MIVNTLLVCLWMADVGARDPLIVGDSEFPWPILVIVAWASVIALSVRRANQRLPRGSRRREFPAQQP